MLPVYIAWIIYNSTSKCTMHFNKITLQNICFQPFWQCTHTPVHWSMLNLYFTRPFNCASRDLWDFTLTFCTYSSVSPYSVFKLMYDLNFGLVKISACYLSFSRRKRQQVTTCWSSLDESPEPSVLYTRYLLCSSSICQRECLLFPDLSS